MKWKKKSVINFIPSSPWDDADSAFFSNNLVDYKQECHKLDSESDFCPNERWIVNMADLKKSSTSAQHAAGPSAAATTTNMVSHVFLCANSVSQLLAPSSQQPRLPPKTP